MVLRGCKLRNTELIYGMTIFTGHDTKIMQNSAKAKYKFSKLEQYSNKAIFMVLTTMLAMSLIAGIIGTNLAFGFAQTPDDNNVYGWVGGAWYLEIRLSGGSKALEALKLAGTWVILFTNLVPISLLVSLELVKFAQAIFMTYDIEMFDEEEGI